nr:polysaccharide pyruvyl transferase family protein [Arthrobacter pigmenti]
MVITTYPAQGSRNIGDYLITQSLVSLIQRSAPGDVVVEVVWRAAPWKDVVSLIERSDHVFFACLAIRSDMEKTTYPYARRLLESGVPYSILAAGTDLPVKGNSDFCGAIDSGSLDLLRVMSEGARIFTTRGILTQNFCLGVGIKSAVYHGDISFFAPESDDREFTFPEEVRSIVLSDPHRPEKYLSSFSALVAGIRCVFPDASLSVALHGVNDLIQKYCVEEKLDCEEIFKSPARGLEFYNKFDLHVGYRVHGHVNALNRRMPSYLLEQDGRGADYGLSLSRKLSVPNYLQYFPTSAGGIAPLEASISAPQQVISMMYQDSVDGYSRFSGLGAELAEISRRAERTVRAIVDPS